MPMDCASRPLEKSQSRTRRVFILSRAGSGNVRLRGLGHFGLSLLREEAPIDGPGPAPACVPQTGRPSGQLL
ncbi:unnamed protein product [Protopolystoma xenopodis]|uniref:Uncharacterized protein n=1 Tax=Protopolystoma xenopodis TaxID=117903 RepID=A0A3S5BDN9_9PLAT|nr:unnamed protein product [Protopolystoma xenopodis]